VRRLVLTLSAQAALLGCCYWATLERVVGRWATDPQSPQGYFVIALAALVLWARRRRFPLQPLQGSWWGIAIVVLAVVVRTAAVRYDLVAIEMASLLAFLVGICFVLGGWPFISWAWPAVLLITFLVPLPHRIEELLSNPLRSVATSASGYWMQTLGLPAVAENNIVLVNEGNVVVVETCSGLGTVITLFAMTTAAVFIFRREHWQQLVILFSAIPMALFVNVLRITLTGVCHKFWGRQVAEVFFHDLAGWLLMPAALAILWFVFFVVDNFCYEVDEPIGSLHIVGLSVNRHARATRIRDMSASSGPAPFAEAGK
jgi:exosortase